MKTADLKKIAIKDLKLGEEIVVALHLSGIDTVEDLAGFTLTQLRKYIFREDESQFEQILPILRKYEIPAQVESLSLSKDLEQALSDISITETQDLFLMSKEDYDTLTHDDALFKKELDEIFKLYNIDL
ncbi:MAG: hypothetical protein RBQ63_01030, partial [Acholeplasmatales bacterium]|nr:hypothetical protein [Acholeplasmatales bacterium]